MKHYQGADFQIYVLLILLLVHVVWGFRISNTPLLQHRSSRVNNNKNNNNKNHLVFTLHGITNANNDGDCDNGLDDQFFKSLREKYVNGGNNPGLGLPTFEKKNRPSKSDLYNNEELNDLLNLHNAIAPQTTKRNDEFPRYNDSYESSSLSSSLIPPSIHDLVLQTVDEIDNKDKVSNDSSKEADDDGSSKSSYSWLSVDIRERSSNIIAIASDVDGTLIGSNHKVHPRTQAAVQRAVQAAFSSSSSSSSSSSPPPSDDDKSTNNKNNKFQWFFPATGKTRQGALNTMGPELAKLVSQCPGVFIQGLYCVYGDEVIFEKKLNLEAVKACERLVEETGTSIIAYDGDNLYTTDLTETVIEIHDIWREPMSIKIPSIASHPPGVHKILVCDNDVDKLTNLVRPKLEALAAQTKSCVTQAIPTMLELIPEGCSKALGVLKLCEVLGVDPATQLLALGDAENDVEMLQMAAIGVAVANGSKLAKEAADIVLDESSNEGGAGLAMELLANI